MFYGGVERASNVRFHDYNSKGNGNGTTLVNGVPVFNHNDYKDWLQKRAEYNNIKMD